MTKKPGKIDTSAERVHKNPIAELMRDAADYIDSGTLDNDQVPPVYHELMQAAHDIEQQEPVFMWHRGAADDESEVVDVDCACPFCVPLYAYPQTQPVVEALVEALEPFALAWTKDVALRDAGGYAAPVTCPAEHYRRAAQALEMYDACRKMGGDA